MEKEGLEDNVVASTTGQTGAKAAGIFRGCNVAVFAHSFHNQDLGKS